MLLAGAAWTPSKGWLRNSKTVFPAYYHFSACCLTRNDWLKL